MVTRGIICAVCAWASVWSVGCGNFFPPGDRGELTTSVNAKANAVAAQIGGAAGFGAMVMTGYFDHAAQSFHFDNENDLANPEATILLAMQNGSAQACTFHVAYLASYLGLDELIQDAEVQAGEAITVEIPCAEIIGMGSLETPGREACHLADGQAVANVMSVPAFLGLDYECADTYQFTLTQDVDDLDSDGDTEELILESEALRLHMMNGGPFGHMHGGGMGMMGQHMRP